MYRAKFVIENEFGELQYMHTIGKFDKMTDAIYEDHEPTEDSVIWSGNEALHAIEFWNRAKDSK